MTTLHANYLGISSFISTISWQSKLRSDYIFSHLISCKKNSELSGFGSDLILNKFSEKNCVRKKICILHWERSIEMKLQKWNVYVCRPLWSEFKCLMLFFLWLGHLKIFFIRLLLTDQNIKAFSKFHRIHRILQMLLSWALYHFVFFQVIHHIINYSNGSGSVVKLKSWTWALDKNNKIEKVTQQFILWSQYKRLILFQPKYIHITLTLKVLNFWKFT